MLLCVSCGSSEHLKKAGTRNGKQRYRCTACGSYKPPIDDSNDVAMKDALGDNVRLAKEKQRLLDTQRIERNSFRQSAKIENALYEVLSNLRDIVRDNPIVIPSFPSRTHDEKSPIGIIHLSDLHFNELVDILGNQYDFNIASKRLKKYFIKVHRMFSSLNVTKVYVVFTGDLLNSDRRTDELLSMATSRAKATFLATKILMQFIVQVSLDYDVGVISVTGNESRIRDEYSHIDVLATDNFDFMIYEMMKMYLDGGNIDFVSGDSMEHILTVHGRNILVVHGNGLGRMTPADLNKAIAKWTRKGIIVDHIMCGHLHETLITDTLFRNGSLVGNNSYADSGLNLCSRASQNSYIVHSDGSIDAIRVDLQNVDGYSPMYEVGDDSGTYIIRSVTKSYR